MRRVHPSWGPRTLKTKLVNEFAERAPSRAAIYRALVRHQLITPTPRRRPASSYKRWERSRSMELWQMDVVGRIFLTDGTELKCVTGIDDHSRFCVSAYLVTRATAQPVCDALLAALRRHGVPQEILTTAACSPASGPHPPQPCNLTGSVSTTASLTGSPHRFHPRRPAKSNACTAPCATNSSTTSPSTRWRRPKRPSTRGSSNTTRSVNTSHSVTLCRRDASSSPVVMISR